MLPIAFWYHHPKRSPTVVCRWIGKHVFRESFEKGRVFLGGTFWKKSPLRPLQKLLRPGLLWPSSGRTYKVLPFFVQRSKSFLRRRMCGATIVWAPARLWASYEASNAPQTRSPTRLVAVGGCWGNMHKNSGYNLFKIVNSPSFISLLFCDIIYC